MLIKYATAQVLQAEEPRTDVGPLLRPVIHTAHRATFDYTPRPGYIYVRSRAISSRCNDNWDEFPAAEIAKAWRSFIGRPAFVNHANSDHRRARGVLVDAALHTDTNPDGSPDTWVEVLHEIDAVKFPKLAEAIREGKVSRTSMGTDVAWSLCSFCGNKATTPLEYCAHIPRLKGKRIRRVSGDQPEDVLVREICYGLNFFENSLLVEDPADPTAYILGVDDHAKVAAKVATDTLVAPKVKKGPYHEEAEEHTHNPDDPVLEHYFNNLNGYNDSGMGHASTHDPRLHGDFERAQQRYQRMLDRHKQHPDLPLDEAFDAASNKVDALSHNHNQYHTPQHERRHFRADDYRSVWTARKTAAVDHPFIHAIVTGLAGALFSKVKSDYDSAAAMRENYQKSYEHSYEAVTSAMEGGHFPHSHGDGHHAHPYTDAGHQHPELQQRSTLAFGETVLPQQVDTLRQDECVVCGNTDPTLFNGPMCTVCGFDRPLEGLQDPDLDAAQLREDEDKNVPEDEAEDEPPEDEPAPKQGSLARVAQRTPSRETGRMHRKAVIKLTADDGTEHEFASAEEADAFEAEQTAEAAKQGGGGGGRRDLFAALGAQQTLIDTLTQRLAVAERRLAFVGRAGGLEQYFAALASDTDIEAQAAKVEADINNPAQPIPDPPSEAPVESTQEARSPNQGTDHPLNIGETPGTDVSPDGTADVMTPGQVTPIDQPDPQSHPHPLPMGDVPPGVTGQTPPMLDVTAPVAGTEGPRPESEVVTYTDVKVNPNPMNPDTMNPWILSSRGSGTRTMLALRLAKARLAAGTAGTDSEFAEAQTIDAGELPDKAIEHEALLLEQLQAKQPSRRRPDLVPRAAMTTSRQAPSMAGGPPPVEAVDDDQISDLFD